MAPNRQKLGERPIKQAKPSYSAPAPTAHVRHHSQSQPHVFPHRLPENQPPPPLAMPAHSPESWQLYARESQASPQQRPSRAAHASTPPAPPAAHPLPLPLHLQPQQRISLSFQHHRPTSSTASSISTIDLPSPTISSFPSNAPTRATTPASTSTTQHQLLTPNPSPNIHPTDRIDHHTTRNQSYHSQDHSKSPISRASTPVNPLPLPPSSTRSFPHHNSQSSRSPILQSVSHPASPPSQAYHDPDPEPFLSPVLFTILTKLPSELRVFPSLPDSLVLCLPRNTRHTKWSYKSVVQLRPATYLRREMEDLMRWIVADAARAVMRKPLPRIVKVKMAGWTVARRVVPPRFGTGRRDTFGVVGSGDDCLDGPIPEPSKSQAIAQLISHRVGNARDYLLVVESKDAWPNGDALDDEDNDSVTAETEVEKGRGLPTVVGGARGAREAVPPVPLVPPLVEQQLYLREAGNKGEKHKKPKEKKGKKDGKVVGSIGMADEVSAAVVVVDVQELGKHIHGEAVVETLTMPVANANTTKKDKKRRGRGNAGTDENKALVVMPGAKEVASATVGDAHHTGMRENSVWNEVAVTGEQQQPSQPTIIVPKDGSVTSSHSRNSSSVHPTASLSAVTTQPPLPTFPQYRPQDKRDETTSIVLAIPERPASRSSSPTPAGDRQSRLGSAANKETPTSTPSITPSITPNITPSITPSITPIATPSVTPSVTPLLTPQSIVSASKKSKGKSKTPTISLPTTPSTSTSTNSSTSRRVKHDKKPSSVSSIQLQPRTRDAIGVEDYIIAARESTGNPLMDDDVPSYPYDYNNDTRAPQQQSAPLLTAEPVPMSEPELEPVPVPVSVSVSAPEPVPSLSSTPGYFDQPLSSSRPAHHTLAAIAAVNAVNANAAAAQEREALDSRRPNLRNKKDLRIAVVQEQIFTPGAMTAPLATATTATDSLYTVDDDDWGAGSEDGYDPSDATKDTSFYELDKSSGGSSVERLEEFGIAQVQQQESTKSWANQMQMLATPGGLGAVVEEPEEEAGVKGTGDVDEVDIEAEKKEKLSEFSNEKVAPVQLQQQPQQPQQPQQQRQQLSRRASAPITGAQNLPTPGPPALASSASTPTALPTWADPEKVAHNPKQYATLTSYLHQYNVPTALPLPATFILYFSDTSAAKAVTPGSSGRRNAAMPQTPLDSYSSAIRPLFTCSTVPEFARGWLALQRRPQYPMRPSTMAPNQNLHFFRSDVRPMWEDPVNKRGGRLTLCPPRHLLDEVWEAVLCCCAGGTLGDANEECVGVVMSRRARGDRVEVWLDARAEPTTVAAIKQRLANEIVTFDRDIVRDAKFKKHFDR